MFVFFDRHYVSLCFSVDNGSNKCGPLHRFVLPSQISRDRDNQASLCSSCHRLVLRAILWIYIVLEHVIAYFSSFPCFFRLFPYHMCGLYQDIPRITSSAWPWGTRQSTSSSWTTGRKHTGPSEVQKINIQHAVDLRTLYTLLHAFLLCLLCLSISSAQLCLRSVHLWVHPHNCVPQLLFKSLRLLLSPPWDQSQSPTNTSKNVLPKSWTVSESPKETVKMTAASKHKSSLTCCVWHGDTVTLFWVDGRRRAHFSSIKLLFLTIFTHWPGYLMDCVQKLTSDALTLSLRWLSLVRRERFNTKPLAPFHASFSPLMNGRNNKLWGARK